MPQRILIIEDDPDIGALISCHLRDARTHVHVETDGTAGLALARNREWDLLIVDWALPGTSGVTICRELRGRPDGGAIILLTARDAERDRVEGLDAGADDFVSKPFGMAELAARVRAQLRRRPPRDGEAAGVEIGSLHLQPCSRSGTYRGRALCLTQREFDLLLFLARHPGVAFSRDQLLSRVWGPGFDGYAHTVNSHMNRLRAKLAEDQDASPLIATVWGKGYRLVPDNLA
jgi:DNA-binding response OmpR family regulator